MKIAITRLKQKADRDAALCREYGHECFTVSPLNAEIYQEKVAEFVARVNREEFDSLFFTSALPARVIGPLLERWPRVIAIGPQTARTLEQLGIGCETLPSYYSRNFAPYLGSWLKGRTVGIPRADVPNPELLDSIRAQGGIPLETRIYALVPTGQPLPLDGADAVIFTSANSFRQAVRDHDHDILYVAIGEITAGAMEEQGVAPAVTGDGSLAGTFKALNAFLKTKG